MILFHGVSRPRSSANNLNDVANEAAVGVVSEAGRLTGASHAVGP